ncbi:extradiol ring-cleavage dioxygenase III subunit B [Pseudogulbenkiania sp. NH8B]|uniref:DODA-type extradiol aromatic ring-opening family dioxygenase n=1 Tax=Pseudogulbenkiania sp. (strain NH8B) TaxID=748280 RepID=UPI00022797E9|nr:class III extradiol ring-cleavage dioxygenase [Pseudogulbenkiania sp. NH8B]BAK74934.1 extradiol ring-cleavage dioxygenase III subunit B [Pseudogulbenkiania sp. NH8B]
MSRLPSLFISHGAPTVLIDGSPAPAAWRRWADAHDRPRAIVSLSAHRPARQPGAGSAAHWRTVHDFGGFPEQLYRLQYPAEGERDLADDIDRRLAAAGFAVQPDERPGLDHGAWVPLLAMYPDADIPVVTLPVLPAADAATHYRLGQALARLGEEGVLLVGSGSLTHNLYEVAWNAGPEAWALEFQSWMLERLAAGDVDAVLDWERQAPQARRNHPTAEHLLPLFFALGAGGTSLSVLHGGMEHGSIAMDALAFGENLSH